MKYKENYNEVICKSADDLELLHKCVKLMKHYAQHQEEEVEVTLKNIYGENYTLVYPAGNVYRNFERIVKVNGYSGYVVLDDGTILCVCASSWIAQFDGCLESEINMNVG